MLEIRCHF